MPSNSDLILTKLQARYPTGFGKSINDLLHKFWIDNNPPTGQPKFGLPLKLFYKPAATSSESLSSVERAYWEALVP